MGAFENSFKCQTISDKHEANSPVRADIKGHPERGGCNNTHL
uniref:Uncharacterized protein n=1 Tax=Arundo donax TaxID=35708 RepID=A0A0A8YTB7_ARUDO